MIDWNDCTPLTRNEFDDLIGAAIPFLKDMEMKNGWDFVVNNISTSWFCERFLIKARDLNDYEDYQKHNTKVQDFRTIYSIIVKSDWTHEDTVLRENLGTEIWKLVLDKVNSIADSVF